MQLEKIGMHVRPDCVEQRVVGIDHEGDDFHPVRNMGDEVRRRLGRDCARGGRKEIQADMAGARRRGHGDGFRRFKAADFDVHCSLGFPEAQCFSGAGRAFRRLSASCVL